MTRSKPLRLADLPAKKREHLELCVHEAAHAVAGVVYGARLRSAVVASGRVIGNQGLTRFEPDDFPGYRKPEIAYSGSYGQAKFRVGGRRPTQREFYAVLGTCGYKDDWALSAAAAASATGDHSARDVKPIIDRCWPAVITLARKLHHDGEVSHDDVLAALGITDGGGLASVQLASLRSGFRSVPSTALKQLAPA